MPITDPFSVLPTSATSSARILSGSPTTRAAIASKSCRYASRVCREGFLVARSVRKARNHAGRSASVRGVREGGLVAAIIHA